MAWTFRFLEDIALADIGFEAEGESVEEMFRGATQALIESMANPSTVSGGWERVIERSDVDPAALLFEWLSEVVYWKDAAGVVFREASLALTREGEVWLLRTCLIGAPVNYQPLGCYPLHCKALRLTKWLLERKRVTTLPAPPAFV